MLSVCFSSPLVAAELRIEQGASQAPGESMPLAQPPWTKSSSFGAGGRSPAAHLLPPGQAQGMQPSGGKPRYSRTLSLSSSYLTQAHASPCKPMHTHADPGKAMTSPQTLDVGPLADLSSTPTTPRDLASVKGGPGRRHQGLNESFPL